MADQESLKPMFECNIGIATLFFLQVGETVLLMQSYQGLCENIVLILFYLCI